MAPPVHALTSWAPSTSLPMSLLSRQPAKVMFVLTPPSDQKPKEMDLKPAESITSESVISESATSESVTPAAVEPPEPEPMLPADDKEKEKESAEMSVSEGTSEGEKQASLPALSSSCTSEDVLDPCEESVGNSESAVVKEELPEPEAEEQQTKTE